MEEGTRNKAKNETVKIILDKISDDVTYGKRQATSALASDNGEAAFYWKQYVIAMYNAKWDFLKMPIPSKREAEEILIVR